MVSFLPFFCLFGDNSVLFRYCLVLRPFCIFLLFPSDLWSRILFLFCFPPFSLIGKFPFLLSSDSFDREFSPFLFFSFSFFYFLLRARFMVSWDFGSRLVERMDMIYVRVLVWFRDKRECPTLFPWHKCKNDDLETLCKTGHACTYVDTQVSNFMVMWC